MGFKLSIGVGKEHIDHGHDGQPYYHEDVYITGNSVCDTVCIQQDGQTIGMSVRQFEELMQALSKTSFWYYANMNKLGEQE